MTYSYDRISGIVDSYLPLDGAFFDVEKPVSDPLLPEEKIHEFASQQDDPFSFLDTGSSLQFEDFLFPSQLSNESTVQLRGIKCVRSSEGEEFSNFKEANDYSFLFDERVQKPAFQEPDPFSFFDENMDSLFFGDSIWASENSTLCETPDQPYPQ